MSERKCYGSCRVFGIEKGRVQFKERALRSKKGKKPTQFTASGSLVAPTDMTKLSGGRFQISVLGEISVGERQNPSQRRFARHLNLAHPQSPWKTGNLQKVSQNKCLFSPWIIFSKRWVFGQKSQYFAQCNHLGCLCVRSYIFFSAIKGCLCCLFALFMWWPTMRLVALYLQGGWVGLGRIWGVLLLMQTVPTVCSRIVCTLT